MPKQPFSVAIPDETLTDLKERLARVRWPDDFANSQWEYGTNLGYQGAGGVLAGRIRLAQARRRH